jgi:lambda repressor-like predicted transcriptional regulator
MKGFRFVASLALGLLAAACAGPSETQLVASSKSAVELRSMQARTFETADRNRILRGIVATLHDHGYAINRVSAEAGTATATKAAMLRLSASVYPRGEGQTVVRANAVLLQMGRAVQIDDPTFYRDRFFEPLSRTLALTAAAAPDREEAAPPPAVPLDQPGTRPTTAATQ